MKQWKFTNILLSLLLAFAVLSAPVFAQEEAEEDEPAETGTLVVDSENPDGKADYIYVLGEEQPGISASADGAAVSAVVGGDTYSAFGGVNVLTANNGTVGLDLSNVRGRYGFWMYQNTGTVTAAADSITAYEGSGIEAVTAGDAVLDLTASNVSSSASGILIRTGAGIENYEYGEDFTDPGDPDDWGTIEDDTWYENDGASASEGSPDGNTPGTVTGSADVTLTLGSIEASENGAEIEVTGDDTVTLTAEDYIAADGAGVVVNLYGEKGSAKVTAPIIDAAEHGLAVYAAGGSVEAVNEDYISADSAVEITNNGASVTLDAGYLEGTAGLYIETGEGTVTADTKDITAENYGIFVRTYLPAEYEEFDPEAEGTAAEDSASSDAASGNPTVTVKVNGDITDYINYQAQETKPDIIDPITESEDTAVSANVSKAAGYASSNDGSSAGIIVESDAQSTIDISVSGGIETGYGSEIEAFDKTALTISVADDVTTDYGNHAASYDGSSVTLDFGGNIYAGGKALDTAAYAGKLDITVKGDIDVLDGKEDEETAAIYANSADDGETSITVEGGITVSSGNDTPTYGISLWNTGGTMNVKAGADVKADGTEAVGLEIINDPANDLAYAESGDDPIVTNTEITGNLSGSSYGLLFDTAGEESEAKVLVTDTISGSVVISENASPDNFDLAVWKIEKTNENAALTPDGQPSAFEPHIKYIIKIDPADIDKIKAVREDGSELPVVTGPISGEEYPYMKEGEKVYLEALGGYNLTGAYNGKETKTALFRDANGRFFLEVPKGGAVWLSVGNGPAPEPQPDKPCPCCDLSWLCGCELPHTGFSASRFTNLPARPKGLAYRTTGLTLQIPELDIAEEIVTVPEVDSAYPVEWLGSEVGLLEGSSLPGSGITVLTGHNHLNTTEAGPFLFLGTLSEGDLLMINNRRNEMKMYRVYGNYKISRDGFASISEELRENALVLITCEDESVDGGYLSRRVILAEPA